MVVVAAAFGGYLMVGADMAIVGVVDRADEAVVIDTCTDVRRGTHEWLDTCTAVACTAMTVRWLQVYLESGVDCLQ